MHFPELYAPYSTAVKYPDARERALDFLCITERRSIALSSGQYDSRTNTWIVSIHFEDDPYYVGYLVEVTATDAQFYDGEIFTNELTPEQKLHRLSTSATDKS